MPARNGDDGLREVAVADDNELGAAAVDVATLPGKVKQCRVDDDLFVLSDSDELALARPGASRDARSPSREIAA